MNRTLSTEVLVVGAGPVGMTTALLLAQAGVRVTIIDAERRAAARSYACGLHPPTLKLLEALGVLSDATQQARRIESVTFCSPERGREADLSLSGLSVEHPYVLVLPQDRLEALLADRLAGLGCRVLWHHRLTDLSADASGVRAEVDQLVGTATGCDVPRWQWVVGRTLDVDAAFVVGADGHHSLVRQRLGIENERFAPSEHYVVYEFETARELADELCVVLTETTKNVLWPLPGRRCRWSFQLAEAEESEFSQKDRNPFWGEAPAVARRSEERLHHRLESRAPWFGAGVGALDWAVDIQFQHRLARRYGRDRCWLVGDAAHQTSPAGMQSMNVGMLEAQAVADGLTRILRGEATIDLLIEYDRRQRDTWRGMLGAKGTPRATGHAARWIEEHLGQIPSLLPASGAELHVLLDQLGVSLS